MKQIILYEIKLYRISFSFYSFYFSCNSIPLGGCSAFHGMKPNFKKCIVKNMPALFISPHWLNLTLNLSCIQKTFQKANMPSIKETYSKSSKTNLKAIIVLSKRAIACVNDCSKVKLHGLVGPLNFISLGMDFSDPWDQQITDQANKSKHLHIQLSAFKF